MKNKFVYLTIAVSCISFQKFNAQELEVLSASGAQLVSGNAMLDFTIGEPVVGDLETNDANLSQGFHQTNLTISNISEIESMNFSVFPNPTKDWFTIESEEISNAKFEIHSLNGAIVYSSELNDMNTQVNIEQLSSGTYLLVIYTHETSKTIYKINKIN